MNNFFKFICLKEAEIRYILSPNKFFEQNQAYLEQKENQNFLFVNNYQTRIENYSKKDIEDDQKLPKKLLHPIMLNSETK